jgi:hypothetical protein
MENVFEQQFNYEESHVIYQQHKNALDKIIENLDNNDGGIFIQAPTVSGKTHLLRWLAYYYSGSYINSFEIKNEEDFFEEKHLCIDALGMEKTGAHDLIRRLIFIRKHLGYKTYLATSFTMDEIKMYYGASFVDLIKRSFVIVAYACQKNQ